MNRSSVVVLSGMLALTSLGAPVAAEIKVQFIQPKRYTDAGRHGYGYGLDRTLESIEAHLHALGKRCLAPDQSLEIRVDDIDLAGQHEWWRSRGYDFRVMRDVTWPRMDLQYVWRDRGGALLAETRERVLDMEYLTRSAFVRGRSDPLVYDKAMLTDWFERRFCHASG